MLITIKALSAPKNGEEEQRKKRGKIGGGKKKQENFDTIQLTSPAATRPGCHRMCALQLLGSGVLVSVLTFVFLLLWLSTYWCVTPSMSALC